MNSLHKNLIEFRNNYVYTPNHYWGQQNGNFLKIVWKCSRYLIVKAKATKIRKNTFNDFIPTTYYIFKIFKRKNRFFFQIIDEQKFGLKYYEGRKKMINTILRFKCTNCRINCGKKDII